MLSQSVSQLNFTHITHTHTFLPFNPYTASLYPVPQMQSPVVGPGKLAWIKAAGGRVTWCHCCRSGPAWTGDSFKSLRLDLKASKQGHLPSWLAMRYVQHHGNTMAFIRGENQPRSWFSHSRVSYNVILMRMEQCCKITITTITTNHVCVLKELGYQKKGSQFVSNYKSSSWWLQIIICYYNVQCIHKGKSSSLNEHWILIFGRPGEVSEVHLWVGHKKWRRLSLSAFECTVGGPFWQLAKPFCFWESSEPVTIFITLGSFLPMFQTPPPPQFKCRSEGYQPAIIRGVSLV